MHVNSDFELTILIVVKEGICYATSSSTEILRSE